MSRHRILTALVALIAAAVVGAVVYLETANSTTAASTTATTTTTSTTATTTTTTTLPPTTTTATTTSTVAPTTLPPTTAASTVASTVPTTTSPPPERASVPVVISSGPSDGRRLAPGAELIAAVGWTDVRPLTGSLPLPETLVFFAEGFEASAELLAVDTGLPLTSIAPLAEAPPVAGLANAELLFYLGAS